MRRIAFIAALYLTVCISAFCQATDTSAHRATFKVGKCRATIAGASSGKVNKKKLLKAGKIEVQWCEDSSKVISFTMSIIYNRKENYVGVNPESHWAINKSEYLTTEMLSYIRKAPIGSRVIFADIKYCTPAGEEISLQNGIELLIQ